MGAEKLLTEVACRSAKPRERLYYLNDGAGLRLRVRPDGSRTWIFRYRLGGKETSTGLGVYPHVSLQAARSKAVECREHVSRGSNAAMAKRIAKATTVHKGQETFGVVARDWLAQNKLDWSSHHYERNSGLLNRYLLPSLGRMPIDSITESYLFSVLKEPFDRGIRESARRSRAIAAQVFSYARSTHRGINNPARDMADNPYLKKPPTKHLVALPKDRVGDLINALNKTGAAQILDPKTICALRMALYTGLRNTSIRGAQWKEIDFDAQIWTVPSSRMKGRKEFQTPLPMQAIRALNEIKPLTYRGPDSFIFPGRGKEQFLSENTLRLALHRLGFKVTLHGFRSVICDQLNESGFNADAIERQLDHVEKNQVRRAYLRSNFMEERARMLQWLANYFDTQAKGENTKNNIKKIRAAA